jgi:small-conductance mechanosensitive channel
MTQVQIALRLTVSLSIRFVVGLIARLLFKVIIIIVFAIMVFTLWRESGSVLYLRQHVCTYMYIMLQHESLQIILCIGVYRAAGIMRTVWELSLRSLLDHERRITTHTLNCLGRRLSNE